MKLWSNRFGMPPRPDGTHLTECVRFPPDIRMMYQRKTRRDFLKRSTLIGLLVVTVRSASAHAKMIRSEPKSNAVLRTSPKTIELWFNELLDDDFNTIQVFPTKELTEKTHQNLAKDKPQLDGKDRTHLVLQLPSLEPGTYSVEYRVLSRDGHTAPGRFTFTLLPKSRD